MGVVMLDWALTWPLLGDAEMGHEQRGRAIERLKPESWVIQQGGDCVVAEWPSWRGVEVARRYVSSSAAFTIMHPTLRTKCATCGRQMLQIAVNDHLARSQTGCRPSCVFCCRLCVFV